MKIFNPLLKSVILFLCFFLFFKDITVAQNQPSSGDTKKADSLLGILKTTRTDTAKIKLLINIGDIYSSTIHDTALNYYNKAFGVATRANSKKYIASSYNKIGIIYYSQGIYNKAIEHFLKALKFYENLGDKNGMLRCYNNIGNVHSSQGIYNKAIEYYLKALKISEELLDKNGMSTCFMNIGVVYSDQGAYNKAIEYYLKALKINEELGDKNGMSGCYNNIGIIYLDQGTYNKAIEYFLKSLKIYEELGDKNGVSTCFMNIGSIHYSQGIYNKAIEYYLKALKISEELGDKKGMADGNMNIGNVLSDKGAYNKAIEYYLKALKISEELGDKYRMSACYNNIGQVYYDQVASASDKELASDISDKAIVYYLKALKNMKELGDKHGLSAVLSNIAGLNITIKKYNEAIEYAHKGLNIAKEIKTLPVQKNIYEVLSVAYDSLHDYKNAYKYHKLFKQINDSIYNEEKSKQITEMQTKYETEKKEAQIEILNKDKAFQEAKLSRERLLWYGLSSVLTILLALLFFIYRNYRQKQQNKYNIQISKAIIETQEEERNKVGRDLHDSLGGTVSIVNNNFLKFQKYIQAEISEDYNKALNNLDTLASDIRRIARNMSSDFIIEMGIIKTIQSFVEKYNMSQNKVNIEFINFGEFSEINKNEQLTIYRIVQELVHNCIKYSQANNATLELSVIDDNIILTMEDNGVGFDVEQSLKKGIGLRNIKYRTSLLNGKCHIDSKINKGTNITIEIPIKKEVWKMN